MTAPQGPDARTAAGRGAAPPAGSGPAAAAGTPAASPKTPATPATSGKVGSPAAPAAATAPGTVPAGTGGGAGSGTTKVLAGGSRRPPPRPAAGRSEERTARTTARTRQARLALKRIDPWSVFVFSLIAALLLGIALVAAVAALYAVLDNLGVQSSVNELFDEVTGGASGPLITSRRVVGGAAVLAAVNVVLLTLLATLGSLLYNLCASFTGGVEVTLGERDG